MCVCVHACMCTRVCARVYAHACVHACMCTRVCARVCVHACVCVCVCVCTYVCVCVYVWPWCLTMHLAVFSRVCVYCVLAGCTIGVVVPSLHCLTR